MAAPAELISLRSLDVKGDIKGEFKINKSNAEGLVEGIDNALTGVATDRADTARACLQPLWERLLDIMLPPRRQSSEPPNEKSENTASLKRIWSPDTTYQLRCARQLDLSFRRDGLNHLG